MTLCVQIIVLIEAFVNTANAFVPMDTLVLIALYLPKMINVVDIKILPFVKITGRVDLVNVSASLGMKGHFVKIMKRVLGDALKSKVDV